MKTIICHFCKHMWEFDPPLGRQDECPACHEDARVCLNCRHHDPQAQHECREPQSEWVRHKNAGNFCGDFSASKGGGSGNKQKSEIDKQLNSLFCESKEPKKADDRTRAQSLDDLFKKEL